ncbi:tRNA pseudouridine13 synthase [Pancytospora philotis]|nr:tRNA pseudouridine13 synthase [Pancytospora philotis]
MQKEVGISSFYAAPVPYSECKLKEEIEDFIVYERNEDGVCCFAPVVDLKGFRASEQLYTCIPAVETKEERKLVYERTRYYPFKALKTVDGRLVVEAGTKDRYVCTLMKYNLNTVDAVKVLARRLGVPDNKIQFSGNKDKRGVTFQEISIECDFAALFNYALSASRNAEYHGERYGWHSGIEHANALLETEMARHMQVTVTEPCDRLMLFNIRKGAAKRLGDNTGNGFKIKIRSAPELPAHPRYFLNYFGPQRFGRNMNNHVIGGLILEGQYTDALDLIMASGAGAVDGAADPDSRPRLSSCQRFIEKRRQQKAKDGYIAHSLDRLSQMMYMHAYQSNAFNHAVNERLEAGRPFPGDCVLAGGEYVECAPDAALKDIYIPLVKGKSKFLLGGYRKMIEEISELVCTREDDGVTVEFFLNKSCYATCALRELVGDAACAVGE